MNGTSDISLFVIGHNAYTTPNTLDIFLFLTIHRHRLCSIFNLRCHSRRLLPWVMMELRFDNCLLLNSPHIFQTENHLKTIKKPFITWNQPEFLTAPAEISPPIHLHLSARPIYSQKLPALGEVTQVPYH